MKYRVGILALVLVFAVSFCFSDRSAAAPAGAVGAVPVIKSMTWKIGDVTREAMVYIPAHVGKSPPIIFGFHGHGGTSRFAVRKFDFQSLWPEAICVYPQGLPTVSKLVDPKGERAGWQKDMGDQGDRDLKFFDAMLKTFRTEYHADPHRTYVCGHSNGGIFAYVLWAARGDEIAAVAPISAILDVRDMRRMKPMPVLHVAGENDPLVKFEWQKRTIEEDRKIDGCDAKGKPAGEHCVEYTSKDGPPVVAYIHAGGHEMPAGAPKRIIAFFKDNPKR